MKGVLLIKLTLFFLLNLNLANSFINQVHTFYYLWYGNPTSDGEWKHWNHEVLPHWHSHVNDNFPSIGMKFEPPEQIHSPFYPLKGTYSSRDPETIYQHFGEMKRANIDVAVMSWWGQLSNNASTDTQGVSTDAIVGEILNLADIDGGIKIAFHLEPYPGRSAKSVHDDLIYIQEKYGNHSSYFRSPSGLPLVYIYDSYHISPKEWARLLSPGGDLTVRGTSADAIYIGLWLDRKDGQELKDGGFDGIYTYFASDGFSYGSTVHNWAYITSFCRDNNLFSVLSVGPGYNDTRIRPWNAENSHDRQDGEYFRFMGSKALQAAPDVISITSFNEWGEGTQIEPARYFAVDGDEKGSYSNYGHTLGPYGYIQLTAELAYKFKQKADLMDEL